MHSLRPLVQQTAPVADGFEPFDFSSVKSLVLSDESKQPDRCWLRRILVGTGHIKTVDLQPAWPLYCNQTHMRELSGLAAQSRLAQAAANGQFHIAITDPTGPTFRPISQESQQMDFLTSTVVSRIGKL